MQKTTEPEYGVPDAENPEWTEERFRRAKRFHEMPLEYQEAFRRSRGPQKAPVKQRTSIRLSAEVMEALRATGPGWQARANEALRKAFVR